MPNTDSKHFGEVEYSEAWAIDFPQGIPGFEGETRFVVMEREECHPILYLQSLATPSLCFLMTPAVVIDPRYEICVRAEDLRTLELEDDLALQAPEHVACWIILSIPEREAPSANLAAPIIVNWRSRRALQAIRADSRYSARQLLGSAELGLGVTCS